MVHTSVSNVVVYCLRSKLPTHQCANITVHSTQNEKTVTTQLCQYQYSSTNNAWLVENELEWMSKEVVTACLMYYCNICLKGQKKANEHVRLAGSMDKIHTRHYHLNQSLQ